MFQSERDLEIHGTNTLGNGDFEGMKAPQSTFIPAPDIWMKQWIAKFMEGYRQLGELREDTERAMGYFGSSRTALAVAVAVAQNAVWDADNEFARLERLIEEKNEGPTWHERRKLEDLQRHLEHSESCKAAVEADRAKLNELIEAVRAQNEVLEHLEHSIKDLQLDSEYQTIGTTPQQYQPGEHSEPALQNSKAMPLHAPQPILDPILPFDPNRAPPAPPDQGEFCFHCGNQPQPTTKQESAAAYLEQKKEDLWHAKDALKSHRLTYKVQHQEYVEQEFDRPGADLETEFATIFIKRGRAKTRTVRQAERNLEEARKLAKEARVPNAWDQESDFLTVPGEGFDAKYRQALIDATNKDRVQKWAKQHARKRDRPEYSQDSLSDDSVSEYYGPGYSLSKRSHCSEYERLAEVDVWDSISVVEENQRKRRKIADWIQKVERPCDIAQSATLPKDDPQADLKDIEDSEMPDGQRIPVGFDAEGYARRSASECGGLTSTRDFDWKPTDAHVSLHRSGLTPHPPRVDRRLDQSDDPPDAPIETQGVLKVSQLPRSILYDSWRRVPASKEDTANSRGIIPETGRFIESFEDDDFS
ncbi:hypothetical protein BDV96DRAFT_644716 [Lophiotrema nucula]|uniref:Uncharacterized protein n=1 Tax=Lophiotrema nucula TaxID=690887 RepID=A0A6A5ZEC8_9PLEO|nr:hypothetical protein BDV96DRAFT_644716 [Lophiotrema nucula]